MSPNILHDARDKIDAEILVLQERIRSLRSSRNTLSLIHRLPPEVMAQIFVWLQVLYRGTLEWNGTDAVSLPKWIHVTHVSQRWRNIAQSSKALYSTILTHNLAYSKEMLRLSGSAPLSLIDSVDYRTKAIWDTQDLQDLIVAALPRVRNLWLGGKSSEFLLPHLERSELALEELCLWEWDSFSPTLLPNSLRYLRLHNCPFDSYEWFSGPSNIVELTLTAGSDFLIAICSLLDILDQMPKLTYLELSYTLLLKEASPTVDRVSPVIPKLQHLKVTDLPGIIVDLLPWLTFAPRFTIHLSMDVELDTVNAIQWIPTFFEQIGRHLRASSMVLRAAKFIHDNKELWNGNILFSEEANEEPCLQLQLTPSRQVPFPTCLKHTEVLPLDSIESLTVDAARDVVDWGDSPWRSLRTLRQMVLSNGQISSEYLKYLIGSAETQYSRRSAGVDTPFASLEELSLCGIDYCLELKSKVRAALNERKESGSKLRKLAFRDCNISEDSIIELSRVVDVVECHEKKRE